MGIRTPESVRTTALKAVALGHFAIPPHPPLFPADYKTCRSLPTLLPHQFRPAVARDHVQPQLG